MAIKIITKQTGESLKAKSHWWGFPDLPDGIDFPLLPEAVCDDEGEDLMTFICQIRMEEIAGYDKENLLPHEGMLYFFADLDYFLGDLKAPCEGLGFWREGTYKTLSILILILSWTRTVMTPACRLSPSVMVRRMRRTMDTSYWECRFSMRSERKRRDMFRCCRWMKTTDGI